MDLLQSYIDLLPHHLLNWKVYGAIGIGLALEAVFFVSSRPLLSVELAQDFVFGVFKRWVFLPALLAYAVLYKSLYEVVLPPGEWQIARDWPLAAQVVVGFVAGDFMVFATHFMMHKVRPLWHFHAVHHSQRNLNPCTTHRTHFVEDVLEDGIQFLPLAILGVGYPTWVTVRAFNWVWAHVIHSNVRWNLGSLGRVLVSPQYHRLHHSIEDQHRDRNFAGRLVLWDRLFGTWHPDQTVYPETGIQDPSYPTESSATPAALLRQVGRQYVYPFRKFWEDLRPPPSPDRAMPPGTEPPRPSLATG